MFSEERWTWRSIPPTLVHVPTLVLCTSRSVIHKKSLILVLNITVSDVSEEDEDEKNGNDDGILSEEGESDTDDDDDEYDD